MGRAVGSILGFRYFRIDTATGYHGLSLPGEIRCSLQLSARNTFKRNEIGDRGARDALEVSPSFGSSAAAALSWENMSCSGKKGEALMDEQHDMDRGTGKGSAGSDQNSYQNSKKSCLSSKKPRSRYVFFRKALDHMKTPTLTRRIETSQQLCIKQFCIPVKYTEGHLCRQLASHSPFSNGAALQLQPSTASAFCASKERDSGTPSSSSRPGRASSESNCGKSPSLFRDSVLAIYPSP